MLSIEQKIRQKSFRNEHHRLAVNLVFNYLRIQEEHAAVLRPFRLTLQQFNVLRILRGQHPRAMALVDVKERMLDRHSDVSRLIERLVAKKLVQRHMCPKDRRQVDLLITEKGLDLLKEIDARESDFDRAVSKLSADEARALNELLDKLEK